MYLTVKDELTVFEDLFNLLQAFLQLFCGLY